MDDNTKFSKKEKDDAKSKFTLIGLLFIFVYYYTLWEDGNLKQRLRMILSWVLFFVCLSLDFSNLEEWNFISRSGFQGSFEEYEAMRDNYKTWFNIVGLVWLAFVFYSWKQRGKESS
jgi:hypothetical protein